MTLKDAIKVFRSKWQFIFGVTVVAFICASVYFYYNPVLFTSSLSFLVDEEEVRKGDQNLDDQNIYSSESWPNGYRLYHMVRSTEMADHLIAKFNLYDHYKIDKTSPLHYEAIHARLREMIGVTNIASGAINITFRGSNRQMVADIANAIYDQLEVMIKEYSISNMKRKLKIYSEILDRSKQEVDARSRDLRQTLAEFKNEVQNSKINNSDLSEMNYKLGTLNDRITSAYEDMMRTVKNHEITIAMSSKENLPNIKLITKALADTGPSLFLCTIKRILIFTSCVLFLTLFVVIMSGLNKEQERFVYMSKPEKVSLEN